VQAHSLSQGQIIITAHLGRIRGGVYPASSRSSQPCRRRGTNHPYKYIRRVGLFCQDFEIILCGCHRSLRSRRESGQPACPPTRRYHPLSWVSRGASFGPAPRLGMTSGVNGSGQIAQGSSQADRHPQGVPQDLRTSTAERRRAYNSPRADSRHQDSPLDSTPSFIEPRRLAHNPYQADEHPEELCPDKSRDIVRSRSEIFDQSAPSQGMKGPSRAPHDEAIDSPGSPPIREVRRQTEQTHGGSPAMLSRPGYIGTVLLVKDRWDEPISSDFHRTESR